MYKNLRSAHIRQVTYKNLRNAHIREEKFFLASDIWIKRGLVKCKHLHMIGIFFTGTRITPKNNEYYNHFYTFPPFCSTKIYPFFLKTYKNNPSFSQVRDYLKKPHCHHKMTRVQIKCYERIPSCPHMMVGFAQLQAPPCMC